MRRAAGWARSLPRWSTAAFALVVTGLLSACGVRYDPIPFTLGQSIPVGDYTLSVSHVESVDPHGFAMPEIARAASGTDSILIVYLEWAQKGSADDHAQATQFVKQFIFGGFTLVDEAGGERRPLFPIPADMYRAAKSQQTGDIRSTMDWMGRSEKSFATDWVVFFTIPKGRRNFSLQIENGSAKEGQPHLASVPLGR